MGSNPAAGITKKKREAIPLFLVFSAMYGKPLFDVVVYTDLVAIFFGKLKIGGCTTAFSIPESKCPAVWKMSHNYRMSGFLQSDRRKS